MVNMTVYRAVFTVFPFENFITGSSKMVTKSTNMIFSSSACKKTLLLSLWLAVFDSNSPQRFIQLPQNLAGVI